MNDKTTYRDQLAAQLKEWSAEIDVLEARICKLGADMKLKHAEEIRDLRVKQQAASGKLEELGKASGEAWVQVKNTADNVWEELKTGVAATRAKFK